MNEFEKIIAELISLFRELTEIERIKLNAGRNNQVSGIEECMTKEQSLILRLRGLDKDREEKQKGLGYGGMRFQEILMQASPDDRERLLPLFDGLSREIQMFQEVSGDASHIMEVNARQIQKEIIAREGQIYKNSGKEQVTEKHMTDRSI